MVLWQCFSLYFSCMKRGRLIIYIFALVLPGLFALLAWNGANTYRFERVRVQEKIEASVKSAADFIQNYNGSLGSNMARMLTDEDYESKVSFAAGFTHNRSKIEVTFSSDDTAGKKNIPIKPAGKDTILNINKEYLRKNHVVYDPLASMSIRQFDSLFRIQLKKNGMVVPYSIRNPLREILDTPESKSIIVSVPFILDFANPKIYSIHYTVPVSLVLKNIVPYLASSLLLSVLLVFGTVFLYRSYRLQGQLSEFKESLLGNITHELKTPLTSLQLIVDSAKKSVSDGETVTLPARHIQFAENELNRMKLIVDKILSFSKMSREQFTFNKERVDLDHIVTESLEVMEINVQQANGIINYENGNSVTVLGDPVLLLNAVSTILDNALKYTAKPPLVGIRLARDGQYAIIAIQDNGIGIPAHLGKKIFEPFFRVPTGNVYNTAGHGLGLSFVRQVMKLHGGTVSFASSDEGTTFYLKFKIS